MTALSVALQTWSGTQVKITYVQSVGTCLALKMKKNKQRVSGGTGDTRGT